MLQNNYIYVIIFLKNELDGGNKEVIEEANKKKIRILSLFEMLNRDEIIKKKEAAEIFDVSEKTIHRDLKEINIYYTKYKYKNAN